MGCAFSTWIFAVAENTNGSSFGLRVGLVWVVPLAQGGRSRLSGWKPPPRGTSPKKSQCSQLGTDIKKSGSFLWEPLVKIVCVSSLDMSLRSGWRDHPHQELLHGSLLRVLGGHGWCCGSHLLCIPFPEPDQAQR